MPHYPINFYAFTMQCRVWIEVISHNVKLLHVVLQSSVLANAVSTLSLSHPVWLACPCWSRLSVEAKFRRTLRFHAKIPKSVVEIVSDLTPEALTLKVTLLLCIIMQFKVAFVHKMSEKSLYWDARALKI